MISNKKVNSTLEYDNGDEPLSNFSGNTHMTSIIEKRFSRRTLLQSMAGVTAVSFLGGSLVACGGRSSSGAGAAIGAVAGTAPIVAGEFPKMSFSAIPTSRADTITLPAGYQWAPLVPWGEPICGTYPDYLEDATNTGSDALQQMGMNHDGMHFFPIDDSSTHGLLVLNHEYVERSVLHPNGPTRNNNGQRVSDEVLKEMAAHGVAIIEIKRGTKGGSHWEVERGAYNRRVTALTEMEIRGPARGHEKLITKYSKDGTLTRGTINNCANGYTPWGTYLTAEENWAGYFKNTGSQPREHRRYGVRGARSKNNTTNGWEMAEPTLPEDQSRRFNATGSGDSAENDYRNEPNNFGWIVEIDPFDPKSTPKKRTSFGRFGHEGVVFAKPVIGEPLTFYSGDDSSNEYIYKFVSKRAYDTHLRGDDLLDEGTLYAAKFNDDGSGEWLALDLNDSAFKAKVDAAIGTTVGNVAFDGFSDQGDLLINTRLAADIAGATPMDRPEWGAICPRTGQVYFTLTNNGGRSEATAPNPRIGNSTGHIIRWAEKADHKLEWDIFVLAGGTAGEMAGKVLPNTAHEKALDDSNIFSCPDGLHFDSAGGMWIQTDMSGGMQDGNSSAGDFGNNQMLMANPDTGEIKRFLVGPKDAEITGIILTPDRKTMFINIQHPGDRSSPTNFTSNFPANDGNSRPRSCTVVISRVDGGVIGD